MTEGCLTILLYKEEFTILWLSAHRDRFVLGQTLVLLYLASDSMLTGLAEEHAFTIIGVLIGLGVIQPTPKGWQLTEKADLLIVAETFRALT